MIMKMLVIIAVNLSLAFLVIMVAVNYQLGNQLYFFGFSESDAQINPLVRTSLLFVIMLVGVAAGQLFRDIPKTREITLERVKKSLRKGAFVGSLLGAPIVFGVVYSAARDQPDLVLASVLSFQNGFMCNSILTSLVANKTTKDDA